MNTRSLSHVATNDEDTIAALATPPGTSGIAVIRVSGSKAIDFVADFFRGSQDLRTVPSHTIHHGVLVNSDGAMVDDVLASVFRSPHSYTGEDAVELNCHGGNVVPRAVLETVLACGIRHAEPGEFTRRAFLNGKMDLSQSEAVADLIHAQTHRAHEVSIHQLGGSLSTFIGDIRKRLMHCASMLELSLDFAEEGVQLLKREELEKAIFDTIALIKEALDSYRTGRIIRDGIKVVIAGKPNAGKSSLLNALLGMQRAIVTDIPGTTRDYLEESILMQGIVFRFIDTAGLRMTGNMIEKEGMRLSIEQMRTADIVLYVIDSEADDSGKLPAGKTLPMLKQTMNPEATLLQVWNKIDLVPDVIFVAEETDSVAISARTGEGLNSLKLVLRKIGDQLSSSERDAEVMVTNERHADCLRRSLTALNEACTSLDAGRTEEYITYDIRKAMEALGEIIGEVTSDDILNTIFSRFCIGK